MMSSVRRKPSSRVVGLLSQSEFSSSLFSPWLCELRQDSISDFCDLANRVMKKLEVAPEFYSFFPNSVLTELLIDSKHRQDSFEPLKVTNGSASVICIDNIWQWDPVSAVSAYLQSAGIIDQIHTRLPCSEEEGHTLVDWCQLSKSRDFPSLQMILATGTSEAGRQLLEDLFLCQKPSEELKLIQLSLIDVALNLNVPEVEKLVKCAEPFQTIPRAVFNTLCKRKCYDYLPVVELAVAAAEATASGGGDGSLEAVLRRYENALMLTHCEDVASEAGLLLSTDDDALRNCRPILLSALRDLSQLSSPDEVLMALIRLVGLLPARGCNPSARSNASLIEDIDKVFEAVNSTAAFSGSALERFVAAHNPESLGQSLLAAAYRRHLLPAYRESVYNAGFPQLASPVVQMCRDLAEAHLQPSRASPALQSLTHRPVSSDAATSNVSKLIAMGGVVGRRTPRPYASDLVILLIHGSISWGLAREIVSAMTRSSPQPLEVLIVCNSLLRGRDIFEQCLL